MIAGLADALVALLTREFGDLAPSPRVVAGPLAAPPEERPAVVVAPGELGVSQTARDLGATQSRPQEQSDSFSAASWAAPHGPHTLSRPPLSLPARAVVSFGGGRPARALVEGRDFQIDHAARTLTLNTKLKLEGATTLKATYATGGRFTTCEFTQELLCSVYADSATEADQLAALVAAAVLVGQGELLKELNALVPTRGLNYSAQRRLAQISLLGGGAAADADGERYLLRFRVAGQLSLGMLPGTDEGVIRQIDLNSDSAGQ